MEQSAVVRDTRGDDWDDWDDWGDDRKTFTLSDQLRSTSVPLQRICQTFT